MDDLKQLKLVKNIYIVMSLLFCVLGIFLMARPKSSVKMLCVLIDRKSTRLNSSHIEESRMPSSA